MLTATAWHASFTLHAACVVASAPLPWATQRNHSAPHSAPLSTPSIVAGSHGDAGHWGDGWRGNGERSPRGQRQD